MVVIKLIKIVASYIVKETLAYLEGRDLTLLEGSQEVL